MAQEELQKGVALASPIGELVPMRNPVSLGNPRSRLVTVSRAVPAESW